MTGQTEHIGTRVELHPALDDWMRGDRYGEIVGISRKKTGVSNLYKVKLDKSGKIRHIPHFNIKPL